MRCVKKHFFVIFIAVFTLLLCGCSKKVQQEVTLPYNASDVTFGMAKDDYNSSTMRLFSSDICILDGDINNETGNDYTSSANLVFDNTNHHILYADNVFEKVYPASTTKIMTALCALKYGNPASMVTVSEKALDLEANSSVCNLRAGDQLTLEQCLYGLIVKSGNDAANVIAEAVSGDVDTFVDLMNREAASLGCTGTHFVNPSGLHDEDHYTTAYDLYLMFNEAIKNQAFYNIAKTTKYQTSYTNREGERVSASWLTTDQFLTGESERPSSVTIIGGKTGTTLSAGACLVLLSETEDKRQIVSVVMKSQNHSSLYEEMADMLNKKVY